MRYRKILPLLAVPVIAAACSSSSQNGNQQENYQQGNDTSTIEIVLPLPHFDNSEIRMELIQEEAIQAFGLSSYSFFFNYGDRTPIFECPSVGLPIPADSSLSNPWQVYDGGGAPNTSGDSNVAIGQMDPNGIYMGPTNATYVLCKTANGGQYMNHAEEIVHTVTAQAYWDTSLYGGKGGIHVVGQPQIPSCTQIKKVTYTDSNGNQHQELESICTRPGAAPAPSKS